MKKSIETIAIKTATITVPAEIRDKAKVASALLDESLSDFTVVALIDRTAATFKKHPKNVV